MLLQALRNVAQTKGGMGALAKAAGVSRESFIARSRRAAIPTKVEYAHYAAAG